LNVPYDSIRNAVEQGIQQGTASSLLADELIEKCVEEHPVETYRVLAEILLDLDKAEDAHVFSTKAHLFQL